MNEPMHNEQLLADVLGEGATTDFREGMLKETLRLARRRRHFRHARSAASALAVLVAFGLLVWHPFPSPRSPSAPPNKPYALVRTQPLRPAAWVQTKPLPASSMFVSVRAENIVVTANAGVRVRELNDDELLSLVPKPAALVRFGPHAAELVFVNAEDASDLLRN